MTLDFAPEKVKEERLAKKKKTPSREEAVEEEEVVASVVGSKERRKERESSPGKEGEVVVKETRRNKRVQEEPQPSREEPSQEPPPTQPPPPPQPLPPETPALDKKASLVPAIQVEKDKSPEDESKKRGSFGQKVPLLKVDSKDGDGSRRGSFIEGPASRRGSFLIDGKEGELLGAQLKKTTPSRRGSDIRRGSTTEDDPAEKPSIPLKGCPGPAPKIFDFQPNQSATEGKTAAIVFNVSGDPVPSFQFFKDDTEIFEGGRYKLVTDGSGALNVVTFCVRKSKVNDEGKYKFIAKNIHGQDTQEISLFVGGEEGMDFRAMLRKGKKGGPKKRDDDPDFGNLKSVESERKASIKELKVRKESRSVSSSCLSVSSRS